MRSVLAGLRRLVVPWGARGNTPRVVLGTADPALQVLGQPAGMVWYWRDRKAFVMSVEPSGANIGQFHFYAVENGLLGAQIFDVDFNETTNVATLAFAAPVSFSRGITVGGSTQEDFSAAGATNTVSAAYVPTGVVCSVVSVSPPSGKGLLLWRSAFDHSLAAGTAWAAPEVTGGPGGFLAADAIASNAVGLDGGELGSYTALAGLTPGVAYTATLMHKSQGGGTAFYARREITFTPSI